MTRWYRTFERRSLACHAEAHGHRRLRAPPQAAAGDEALRIESDYLRRSRRAFAVARRCQGARSVATRGIFFARTRVDVERAAADIFSRSIREYSAGEHVPRAIINVRGQSSPTKQAPIPP